MPKDHKRNAIIVCGLAAFFYWAFMFAKHSPALRDVIPFGVDPYDAVGSFGVVIGALIALISLVRAFRPYREGASASQIVYVVRSQAAVALIVLLTVVADAVALARHPSMWAGAESRDGLLALLGALAAFAITVLFLVCAALSALASRGPKDWTRALSVTLFAVMVLAFYPEQLVHGTATHLLTIVAGALLLFVPTRELLLAIVPHDGREAATSPATSPSRLAGAGPRWAIGLFVGVLFGVGALAGEMTDASGKLAVNRLLFVASVYIGLAVAGTLIAYAFLGGPLGLAPRR